MKTFYTFFLIFIIQFSFAQNWQTIASGTQQDLNCLHFIDGNIGYIGGNDSLLLKTIDGGKSWNRIALNINLSSTLDIEDIWFENEQKGYLLLGPFANLYRTIDSGSTWQIDSLNNTNMCFKRSLYFNNFQNGYVGGAMCFQGETVAKRTNGTWATPQAIGSWNADDQITNFDFYDLQNGLASSTSNTIFKTTNGGQTWDSAYSSVDSLGTSDIVFVNDTLAYASHPKHGFDGILISTDAGQTWSTDLSATTFFYPGFNTATKDVYNSVYFGGFPSWGSKGIIQYKKMGAFWWMDVVDQPVNDITTSHDSTVFAVGDSGMIVTNTIPANLNIPVNTKSLIKLYPNPSSGSFFLKGSDLGTLTVVDILGKAIITLNKSEYYLELDLSNYTDGVYFVNFKSGNESQTIKILKQN